MSIRRVDDLETDSLVDLGLDLRATNILIRLGYSLQTIIWVARTDNLEKINGIGKARAKEILKIVDENGFIFHEPPRSQGMRRLLCKIFGYSIETTAEYEAQTEFSEEQLAQMERVFRTLTEQERMVVSAHFGLDGEAPRNFRVIGENFSKSRERIDQVCQKALKKLRFAHNLKTIADIFPNFTGLPEHLKPNNEKATNKKPGQAIDGRSLIMQMPIGCLNLPEKVYRLLTHAEVKTIEDLSRFSVDELAKMPKIPRPQAKSILQALSQFREKAESIDHPAPYGVEIAQGIHRLLLEVFVQHGQFSLECKTQANFSEKQINSTLKMLNDTLPPMEETVMKLRFGLKLMGPLNNVQIMKLLRLSYEEVVTYQDAALAELREPKNLYRLALIFPDFPGFPTNQ